jgi:hypothetical protein
MQAGRHPVASLSQLQGCIAQGACWLLKHHLLHSAGRRLAACRSGLLCLTARQELSRQRVGLASPDNSGTHDSNAGRGPASTRPQDCASARRRGRRGSGGGVTSYTSAASVEDRSRRSYRLHSGGSGAGLETSRCGAGRGPEPADIEGARSRGHGPAAERPALGHREPESTHR